MPDPFTLYIVFHGLMMFFPNQDDGLEVLMPNALFEEKCAIHHAVVRVQKGQCAGERCADTPYPLIDYTIDLGLPTLDDPKVQPSPHPDLWPLSSDLNRAPRESNLAAKLLIEGGQLTTCDIHEVRNTQPRFSIDYTQIANRKVDNREKTLVESVLWERGIDEGPLKLRFEKNGIFQEKVIEPVDCYRNEKCIVLEIANYGINNQHEDCLDHISPYIAKHFRKYLSLLELDSNNVPTITLTSSEPRDNDCRYKPTLPVSGQPGVSDRSACPIVQ